MLMKVRLHDVGKEHNFVKTNTLYDTDEEGVYMY